MNWAQARAAVQAQVDATRALPAAHLRAVFNSPAAQGWPKRKLAEILIETRNGLYKPDSYCGRGQKILKMFNIGRFDGVWKLDRIDLIEVTPDEQETYGLKLGDILLNRVNSRELVGKCVVVDEQTAGAVFESKNIRMRVHPQFALSSYVAICLNSVGGRRQFENRLKQIVGQATINRSDLDSCELPLPSLDLQRELSARLEREKKETTSLTKTLAAKLTALDHLPAALLREAFNGKS
jgi:type I restriction enzyme S subunit